MSFTVSIVIPTYKRLSLLIKCLESIFEQTILPDEIIIGDDSTDDVTEQYIEQLKLTSKIPILYFHHKPSLKQQKNVDFLFKKANCDLLMLLHDDDMLFPSCLEFLKKPLVENLEIIASFGNQIFIANSGDVIEGSEKINADYFRTPEKAGIVNGFIAGAISMFPNNGYLVRREYALTVGYIDNGRAGDAIDFYFGFCLGKLNKNFYYVDEFTAKYRITDESVSFANDNDAAYCTLKILFEDCKQNISPEIEQSIRKKIAMAITIAAYKKDRKNAFKWMFSKYYRKNLVSLRGLKRLYLTIRPF